MMMMMMILILMLMLMVGMMILIMIMMMITLAAFKKKSVIQLRPVQKVTLAVYFYFLAALFGAQWVTPASSEAYEKIYKTNGR